MGQTGEAAEKEPQPSPDGYRRLVLGSANVTVDNPSGPPVTGRLVHQRGGRNVPAVFVDRGPGMSCLPDSAETLAADAETAAAEMADLLLGLWFSAKAAAPAEEAISETFARAVAFARDITIPVKLLAAKAEHAGDDDQRAVAIYLAAIVYGATAALQPLADKIGLDAGEDW